MGKVRQLPANPQRVVHRDQLITLSDLESFKADLLIEIRHLLSGNKGQPDKKWIKSYEVRKLLNVSAGTLQNLRNNGTLPFTRIGGIIYYNSEFIDKMLLDKQKNSLHRLLTKEK